MLRSLQTLSLPLWRNPTNLLLRSFSSKKKLRKWKRANADYLTDKRAKRKSLLKSTPFPTVINAADRDELRLEIEEKDRAWAEEMNARVEKQPKNPLRYDMTGIEMSDRVRKLFDLRLGSRREVVKLQLQKGVALFQKREGDTGSSATQVVALTTRIQQIQTHMRTHRKDNNTKRGVTALFNRRRKILQYLERKDFDRYREVVKTLGLTN